MRNRFDQLGKKVGLSALGPSGRTVAQDEIFSDARHADLRHEPDPARQAERARLGLLGQIASIAGLDGAGGLLCAGIVVASELPRDRSTILVRLMAGGAVLPGAIADLSALPADAHEREVASNILLGLRSALGNRRNRDPEEEAFIVGTQNFVEKLLDQGRDEGRLTQARVAVRRVLAARKLVPSPTDEARLDACTDLAALERWHE
jgi:hypothetical protein